MDKVKILQILNFVCTAVAFNSLGPPRLLPEAFDLERVVPEGSVVQMPCPVEGDPDTLFFEWYRDREPLDTFGEERYRVQGNGVLKIKLLIPEDTGLYVCRAVNGFGSVNVNVTLIVLADDSDDTVTPGEQTRLDDQHRKSRNKEKPTLVNVTKTNNGSLIRPVGGSLKLKCVANGNPEPQITWLRNGQPLADAYMSPGSKKGRWSLYLRNLQEHDDGNYTCVAYNLYGHTNYTFLVHLIAGVRKKPELRGSHPMNITVDAGETATFFCRVKSDAPPHVQWLKQEDPEVAEVEGHMIIKVHGEYFRVIKSTEVSERSDGSFLNKLAIPEARLRDSGKYICLGANTMGYSFRSAFLTVRPAHETYLAEFEEDDSMDVSVQFNPLFITIPVSLGVLITLLVALGVHCHKKTDDSVPRPVSVTSGKQPQQEICQMGSKALSTAEKITFHNALQSSDGTWSQAPSTLLMDPGQPDSFSDCGSSFVFWGDPNLYPDAAYKGGCLLPKLYSPNNPGHDFGEREYVRYLDNV